MLARPTASHWLHNIILVGGEGNSDRVNFQCLSYFFYLLINPPAACLLALGLSLAITPEQSYKVISQTARTKPAVDNKICEPEKCLISAKQNLPTARPSVGSRNCLAEICQMLETQPGRMKKEITLTKPSVGNKIRNTEKCPISANISATKPSVSNIICNIADVVQEREKQAGAECLCLFCL